jgi:hypothetical protein
MKMTLKELRMLIQETFSAATQNIVTSITAGELRTTNPKLYANYYTGEDDNTSITFITVSPEREAAMQRFADRFGYKLNREFKDPDENVIFTAVQEKDEYFWLVAPAYDGTDRLAVRSDDDDIFVTNEELDSFVTDPTN